MSTEIEKLKKAGLISSEVKEYAKELIKKDMPLLEIAEKIEEKIISLGAKPAFPVNLSINEIAAHATPSYDSTETAFGLLKVDLGCHIDGFIADTAFSIDLEDSKENKNLIESAESALNKASEKAKIGFPLSEIGKIVSETVESYNFLAIRNLSGHSIEQYDLHSGITVPNFDNSTNIEFESGVYAIEPFTTTGSGNVREGRPSGIYHLESPKNVRDSKAREVLNYIVENYSTLPFCTRWIHKEFGTRGLLALRQIEQAGLLHHYKQLIEVPNSKVAQAEHTIIIEEKETIITTK